MNDTGTTASEAKVSHVTASKSAPPLRDGFQWPMEDWIHSGETMVRNSFALAHQWVSFGQTRLEDDLKSLKTLYACRNVEEMMQCQQRFAERATAQYLDQARKLAAQITGLLSQVTGPIAKSHFFEGHEPTSVGKRASETARH